MNVPKNIIQILLPFTIEISKNKLKKKKTETWYNIDLTFDPTAPFSKTSEETKNIVIAITIVKNHEILPCLSNQLIMYD